MKCFFCDHPGAHKHRINPGRWGGIYDDDNVINLCPNHHSAIHALMKYWHEGAKVLSDREDQIVEYYLFGPELPFRRFFMSRVKPIIIKRKKAEGTYHPYIRTIPVKESK